MLKNYSVLLTKRNLSLIIFLIFITVFNADLFSTVLKIENILNDYTYPLDDAYIHLSISKNIAEYGIWGITKYEFSNTSSSPLFTIVIALLIKVFGDHSDISLYFNLFLTNFFIFFLYRSFRKSPFQLAFVFFMFFIAVLLKIQVITGMEHVLHIFVICASWIFFHKWYSSDFSNHQYKLFFYGTLPFICLSRYESMFFVAAVILFLLISKQFKTTFFTLVLGFLPVIFFGLYSISNGSYFFPNSLLLKGEHSFSLAKISEIVLNAKTVLFSNLYLPFLVLILLLLFNNFRYEGIRKTILTVKGNLVYVVVLATVVLHLMFAKTGWFYRYDAYLFALLSITVALAWDKIELKKLNLSVTIVSLFLFLVNLDAFKKRFERAEYEIPVAMKNIHDQQIQVAAFLHDYYDDAKVKANDIGAISYKSEIHLLDLFGLGSKDILDIKTKNIQSFDAYVDRQKYDVMVIYDSWFENNKFIDRKKVAELTIKNNIICGDETVSFFIPKNADPQYIIKSLTEFKNTKLPKDVSLDIITQ